MAPVSTMVFPASRPLQELLAEHGGGVAHRIGAVGDDDPCLRRRFAMTGDDPAIVAGHLQAVDHHQRPHVDIQQTAPEPEHFEQMRVLEKELAIQLVVFLVESSARDKQTDGLALRRSILHGCRIPPSGQACTRGVPPIGWDGQGLGRVDGIASSPRSRRSQPRPIKKRNVCDLSLISSSYRKRRVHIFKQ
jgi:hypothetical protein